MRAVIALALACVLVGCSTHSGGIRYTTGVRYAPVSPTAPPVVVGSFIDKRGEPPTWLAAIRGGFGNTLKTLETERPIVELVQTAFVDAMRVRGIRTEAAGGRRLQGVVKTLRGDWYVRRGADVEIEVAVSDSNGRLHFTRTYSAFNVEGSMITFNAGIVADPAELRAFIERTLGEVIDKALGDPELRAALQV